MNATPKHKTPWLIQFAIRLFTVALAVLFFWLLGFLVEDIRSIKGPDYQEIEAKYVDGGLIAKREALNRQISELKRQIDSQNDTQRLIGDSSRNLQQTINQLLELQKLAIQKNMASSEKEQANFTSSLNLFLENQRKYQEMNQVVYGLLSRKQALEADKEETEQQIEQQRKPARQEYDRLCEKHRLRLAFLQLSMLVPLLAVAVALVIKKRASLYFLLFLAFGGATLVKVGLVIHEYFPRRYFKYVLIVALLLAVARMLIYFIRSIAFPKVEWLVRQYREAYERFLCPVCEYPIRIGPRRFLVWTRRTANRLVVPTEQREQEELYTCPSCGATLFEECPGCHKVRHALLPHCVHCGAGKAVDKCSSKSMDGAKQ